MNQQLIIKSMLEGLISQLLNQVLGEFIDDIKPEQLNLSLLKGEVKLQDMAIKSSLFDTLPVPFSLVFGKIGLIRLDVPISNILSRPLIVEVSDIFLVLRPKPMSEWKEEVEIKAFRESTKSKLQSFEVFNQGAEKLAQKQAGTTEKMLEQIVLNTKIDIKNVFVRFEDELTSKKRGSYTIAATIKQIFVGNCNQDWESKEFNKEKSDFVRKIVQLKGFGLSLDWKGRNKPNDFFVQHELYDATPDMFRAILQGCLRREDQKFLLDDFNLECRLEANKMASENMLPQIVASVILGGLHDMEKGILLNLHQPQISFLLKLVEYIGFYNEFTQGALKQYFERTMNLEETQEYIKLYLQWRQMEAQKKKKEAEALKDKLWEIEQNYPYEKVSPIRQIALKMEKKDQEKLKELEAMRQKALELKSQKLGWKGSFFSSKESKEKIQKEVEDFQKVLEEQIQEKFEVQDSDIQQELEQVTTELSETQQIIKGREEMLRIAPDYVGVRCQITLPQVQIRLFNEFSQEIINARIGRTDLSADIGGNFIESELKLESFDIKDLWTKSQSFSDLVISKSKEDSQNEGNILSIKVVIDETNLVTPMSATINSEKSFFLVLNLESFQEVTRTMLLAVKDESFDFTFFSDMAGLTAVQYRNAGKEFLDEIKDGEVQHKSFRLTAHLQPPLVFLPLDIFDRTKPVLLMNTGDLWAKSYLQDYDKNLKYSEIDTCQNFYDEYRVELKDIKVSLLHQGLPGDDLMSFKEAQQYVLLEKTEILLRVFKGLDLSHEKLVAIEALLEIKGLELRLHQKSILESLEFNRQLQNQLNVLQRTLVKSLGENYEDKIENEAARQRDRLKTVIQRHQEEEEKEEEGILLEIRDQAIEANKQQIEKENNSLSFNLIVQINRVSLQLSELKKGKLTPYTQWKLQNLGFFLETDSSGNSRGLGQIYNLMIVNIFPQTHLYKDYKCILASPDQMAQEYLDELQSDDEVIVTSVMKFSVSHQMQFEKIQEYQDHLKTIHANNQVDFKLQILQDKMLTQAQLKELRFIFSIPTIEKLYKYQDFILPKLSEQENLNYQEEVQKLKSLKQLLKALKFKKVTDETQNSLLFRNLVNLSQTLGRELQQIVEGEIQMQQVIVDSFLFISFQQDNKKKEEQNEERKDQFVPLQAEEQKKELVQERERKYQMEFDLKMEGLTIFVPLNSEFPRGQLLSISLTTNFFYFQEQDQTVYTSLETLQQLSIKTNKIRDESHFNVNEIRIETFKSYEEAREFQFSGFDESHRNSVMIRQMEAPQGEESEASVQILESANLSGFMKNTICNGNQNSNMQINLDPLLFKIGFYQINFLCHLQVKIQKTIERRINEIRERRLARGVRLQNAQRPAKEKKEIIQNAKWDKSNSQISFFCEKIQFVIIDDTRAVAKNLLEINLKTIAADLKQFEKMPQSVKESQVTAFLYKLGVKPSLQEEFLKLSSSFEFELIYLNNQNLLYEPFIEPILFQISATQLHKEHYLKSVIKAGSEINLNLTQAFAMALGKVRNRFDKSMKQAHKAYKDPLMPQENESKMTITGSSMRSRTTASQKHSGYLFRNNLGVEAELIFDTYLVNEEEEEKGMRQTMSTKTEEEKIILLPGVDTFFTLQEINQMLRRKYKNSEYNEDNIMQHNLSCELKILYLQKLKNLKFSTLGVHAYSTKWSKEMPHDNQDMMKKDFVILANTQIEGMSKVVSFESSILVANMLTKNVTLGAGQSFKEDQVDQVAQKVEDKIVVEAGNCLSVPLFWFLHQMSLYVKIKDNNWQLVSKNLVNTFKTHFSYKPKDAKLYQIEPNFHAAFNFTGLKCKPKAKKTPEQTLVTIYAPMVLSNFCMNPVNFTLCNEIGKQNLALLSPGESQEIHQVNKNKDSVLLMNMAVQEYQGPIFGQLQNFYSDPNAKEISKMVLQGYPREGQFAKGQEEFLKSFRPLDLRYIPSYPDQLELRQVTGRHTTSQEVFIYPEYMLVNQTGFKFQIKHGDNVLEIGPRSNSYFSCMKKIRVRAQGYLFSKPFDVTTIGVSGEIEMQLENEDLAIKGGNMNYPCDKLTFGISINRCSDAFSRTTSINIVPRFAFVNKLDVPIAVKQKGSFHQKFYIPKGMKAQKQVEGEEEKKQVEEVQDLSFLFELAQQQEVQIRRVTQKEMEQGFNYEIQEEVWSESLDISQPEDFQLCIPDKDFDEDEVLWYKPQFQNNFQRFLRVMITTSDQATLQVVIMDPITPETSIHNKTQEDIAIFTSPGNQEAFSVPRIALKQLITPLVLNKQKKFKLHIGKVEATIVMKELQKKKEKLIPCGQDQFYKVGLAISGNCKSIIVELLEEEQVMHEDDDQQNSLIVQMFQTYALTSMILELSLPGIALSFVDNKPQETLLCSLKDIDLTFRSYYSIRSLDGMIEENQFFYMGLRHIQLDNMASENGYPVIMAPEKNYRAKNLTVIAEEEEKVSVEETEQGIGATPFFQTQATLSVLQRAKSLGGVRVKDLEVILQKFLIQIDSRIILDVLNFIEIIFKSLFQSDSEFNLSERKIENGNELEALSLLQKPRQSYSKVLNPILDLDIDVGDLSLEKIYIDELVIGAIHCQVTFQLDKKAIDFKIVDLSQIVGNGTMTRRILTSVVSITDSPLNFKELHIVDRFDTYEGLSNRITLSYQKQVMSQLYKLLGSSDIIGNPTSLIGSIQSGVHEMVAQPKKGASQDGALGFITGVGKGYSDLTGSVISGTMGTVSNVTGGLYRTIKTTTGQKSTKTQHKEDFLSGVKGAGDEIVQGFKGIVEQPAKGIKKKGAKGFFKGMGKGILGVATAPVNAVLRVSAAATGEASSLTKMKRTDSEGCLITEPKRIRQPRYISLNQGLKSYDRELAKAALLIKKIEPKIAGSQILKYYKVPRMADLARKPYHFILTQTHVILIDYRKGSFIFCIKIGQMKRVLISETIKGQMIKVKLFSKQGDKAKIHFIDSDLAYRVFDAVKELPEVEAEDKYQL